MASNWWPFGPDDPLASENRPRRHPGATPHTPTSSVSTIGNFVDEPMGSKPVSAVPGMDRRVAESLTAVGVATARNLYGYFLINHEDFKKLIEKHGGCEKCQQEVYNAMESYEATHDH